jgi:hypothetical protein
MLQHDYSWYIFFLLYTDHIKCFFFYGNIECSDVHVKFCLIFFDIPKSVFSALSIIGSYHHMHPEVKTSPPKQVCYIFALGYS